MHILYGLVIVSRPVGGIPDWVKVPANGVLTDSLDPKEYAALIDTLCDDKEKMNQIEVTNKEYAQSFFTPNSLTNRLSKRYRKPYRIGMRLPRIAGSSRNTPILSEKTCSCSASNCIPSKCRTLPTNKSRLS
jgi:glycosyltransferase involved in cell wall biosynthesis